VCTLALYFRIFDESPLLVAANRDEHYDRPAAAPSLVETKPKIFAGKDLRAGGTWLGINEHGLLVGVLNRRASTEQDAPHEFRSRGLLCLDLLKCESLDEARGILATQGEVAYRPFTLVLADENAAWAAHNRASVIHSERLDPGLYVFSKTAEFDRRSEKVNRAYRRFATLIDRPPRLADSSSERVSDLAEILGDHAAENESTSVKDAICVHGDVAGTVSSSIICYSRSDREFKHFYSAGAPCQSRFLPQPSLAIR